MEMILNQKQEAIDSIQIPQIYETTGDQIFDTYNDVDISYPSFVHLPEFNMNGIGYDQMSETDEFPDLHEMYDINGVYDSI